MKYLLVLLVVLFGFWLWKHNRRTAQPGRKAQATPPQTVSSPAEMIRCLHCGVHLPQSDAVPGKLGHYCSTAHRSAHET